VVKNSLAIFGEALNSGEPLLDAIKMFFLSLVPLKSVVLLKLPNRFKAYCPLEEIFPAWRNILHIYYYKDYYQVSDFKPKEGWIVVDAGAYLGFYSFEAARLVGSSGLVLAIEPVRESFRWLVSSVELNNFGNVKPVRACLAPSYGEKTLYIPGSYVNASILKNYAESFGEIRRIEKVKSIRLGDIIRLFNRVDLLKLDVEGVELEVLENSKDVLKPGKVKRLIVEVHTDVVKSSEIIEVLENRGYEVVEYIPENAPFQSFIYASETIEIADLESIVID